MNENKINDPILNKTIVSIIKWINLNKKEQFFSNYQ